MNPMQTSNPTPVNNLSGMQTASYAGAAAPFRAAPARATGLSFSRHFTRPGISPCGEITWELRDAIIQDYKGRTIFEQKNVEVPADWSLTATNIVASKYLHGQVGTPERESGVRALITLLLGAEPPAAEPEGRVQFAGLVQRRLRPPGAELRRSELALEPGHPGGRVQHQRLLEAAVLRLLHQLGGRLAGLHPDPGQDRGHALQVGIGRRLQPQLDPRVYGDLERWRHSERPAQLHARLRRLRRRHQVRRQDPAGCKDGDPQHRPPRH